MQSEDARAVSSWFLNDVHEGRFKITQSIITSLYCCRIPILYTFYVMKVLLSIMWFMCHHFRVLLSDTNPVYILCDESIIIMWFTGH